MPEHCALKPSPTFFARCSLLRESFIQFRNPNRLLCAQATPNLRLTLDHTRLCTRRDERRRGAPAPP